LFQNRRDFEASFNAAFAEALETVFDLSLFRNLERTRIPAEKRSIFVAGLSPV
jgi:hypothetical protein